MKPTGDSGAAQRHGAVVAVAIDATGRAVFVSLDEHEFSPVPHFPRSLAEAEDLVAQGSGACVLREELIARYAGRVALLELDDSGHGQAAPVSGGVARELSREGAAAFRRPDGDGVDGKSRDVALETREGVIVGRVCNEQLTIRFDDGGSVTVRVDRRLGSQVSVGQRALLVLDGDGRVVSAQPSPRVFSPEER